MFEFVFIVDLVLIMVVNSLVSVYFVVGKNKEVLVFVEEWINGEKKMEGFMLKGVVFVRQGNSDVVFF